MRIDILFLLNSILLGVGLAMDAFSVCIANGLAEPKMPRGRMCLMAGVYGGFQFLMPMIGWVCVTTVTERFRAFQPFIPWIALALLLYIGGDMLKDGIQAAREGGAEDQETAGRRLGAGTLLLQGIATSIDALSVGFTIAEYTAPAALICSAIVAAVTFGICMGGLLFGKRFGARISEKASILGGVILIGIGLEIWMKGVFF